MSMTDHDHDNILLKSHTQIRSVLKGTLARGKHPKPHCTIKPLAYKPPTYKPAEESDAGLSDAGLSAAGNTHIYLDCLLWMSTWQPVYIGHKWSAVTLEQAQVLCIATRLLGTFQGIKAVLKRFPTFF